MKAKNKLTKRTGYTLSLNEDRGEAFWQTERGVRYGNARKARSKAKTSIRRKQRRLSKRVTE